MPIVYSSGTSWKIPKVKAPTITATHLIAPDGKTSLHTTNSDGTHLLLHGTLPTTDKYIVCQNNDNAVKFSVDHNGNVLSNGNSITQMVVVNTGTLLNATHNATENTIVKRALDSNISGTEFKVLSCERISSSGTAPNIAVYDGAVDYVAEDSNGNNVAGAVCRFGKDTVNFDFATGSGDGLHLERNNNSVRIQTQLDAASLKIEGQKDTDTNYIEIYDEVNALIFSITKEGHLHGAHLLDDLVDNLPDSEVHSSLNGHGSVYVGPVRISFESNKLTFKKLVTIPTVLAASPYNVVSGDLGGRQPEDLSARQWLVLGRNKVSDHTVRAKDIFTNASEWVDIGPTFTSGLTSDAQAQINEINTWLASADTDIDDLETAIVLKAPLDNPTFTTKISTPQVFTPSILSQNAHLVIGSEHTNDMVVRLNSGSGSAETLQITRTNTETRYTAHGGNAGTAHRFMGKVFGNGDIDIAGDFLKNGSPIDMGNLADGGDSSTTTQMNTALALKSDLASPSFSGVPLCPTAGGSTSNTQITCVLRYFTGTRRCPSR